MKRIPIICIILMLIFSGAFAEGIDLSALSFAQLAELRDRCQAEMMLRPEWQEVTVPAGLWIVGEDIPAGHWTFRQDISVKSLLYVGISYGDVLNDDGEIAVFKSSVYKGYTFSDAVPSVDLILEDGFYLQISSGPVIVTPYTGKPDLGFK